MRTGKCREFKCKNRSEESCAFFMFFLSRFLLVHVRENSGEDCTADGMVGAADGAWHDAEGRFRVEGEILRVREECSGEECC